MRPAAEASSSAISRPSLMSISKCIAAISGSKGADEASVNATIRDFVGNVGSGVSAGRSSNLVQLSLYCLGDIGSVRSMDVDMQTIANVFSSDAEDLRAAASFCLGSVAVGNMES